MTHWAAQYIGRPWVSGARGPGEFDCWGLVRWVYAKHYGISLPEYVGIDAADHLAVMRTMRDSERAKDVLFSDWSITGTPTDGCAVLMGGQSAFHHVGVYVMLPEGGHVLHCRAGAGTVLQTPTDLKTSMGFARLLFYRHALHS